MGGTIVAQAVTFGNALNGASSTEVLQVKYNGAAWNYPGSGYRNASFKYSRNGKVLLLYAKSKNDKKLIQNYLNIIKLIGIEHILEKKPLECSGGEKDRAVFARGIIMNPPIILCDEPTSSLDNINKEKLIDLIFKTNEEFSTTFITVTHDLEFANRHDRVIYIKRR